MQEYVKEFKVIQAHITSDWMAMQSGESLWPTNLLMLPL